MKRNYADIPEGQMHYRIERESEPILLLHMAVALSDEFSGVIHFLSRKNRAIAPDVLGAGDSDPSLYEYKIIDYARTVVSLMNTLNRGKANIGGHLFGGNVAAEVAINWPERVNKLILAGPGSFEGTEATAQNKPPNFVTRVEIKAGLTRWSGGDKQVCGEIIRWNIEKRLLEYVKAGPGGEEDHWAGTAII